MARFETRKIWLVFMFILSVFLLAGCGGGGSSGGGGGGEGAIIPGAGCSVAGPEVISSSPSSGNLSVTISSAGVVNDGKLITATFDQAMDPATIESATAPLTFTVIETATGTTVPGEVTMNAANTMATFTTSEALLVDTEYTVSITTDAESATNIAMGCKYEWNFTTSTDSAAGPAAGQPPVDLGIAGTYGIFASADAPITLVDPNVLVDGDVGLMDGAGVCTNCTVTTVTGAIENGTPAAQQAQDDINAAFTDAFNRASGLCTLAANTEIAGPQGACAGYTDAPGSIGPSTHPTYLPGLYWSATTIGLGVTQTIVLDAQGDLDAVFIFQAGSAITTGTNSVMILENGAQAKNVWWMAGSAATLGVESIFKGTVIADTGSISVLNGNPGVETEVEGRLFSLGAAITVDHDATITVPEP